MRGCSRFSYVLRADGTEWALGQRVPPDRDFGPARGPHGGSGDLRGAGTCSLCARMAPCGGGARTAGPSRGMGQRTTAPPTRTVGLIGVAAAAAGFDHSLALHSDGTV